MNMFLSIFVCIAMLCSGTAALPAQPESATTWTLRNLTINYGDDSVTLAPEARLTTAIGADEAQLHFEVGNGDQVLLPVSGEITADGARFSLGANHAYTVSNDVLMEMMNLDEEDQQLFEIAGTLFKDYGVLLGRAMSDADFAQQYSESAMNALLESSGINAEETEVTIDGSAYSAQRIHLELSAESTLAMLDQLAGCGIAEVETLFNDTLALCNLASGEEAANFSSLLPEMEGEEFSIPMDLTIVAQDDFGWESLEMNFSDAEEDYMHLYLEATARGEEVTMDLSMTMASDDNQVNYDLSMEMAGPSDAPEKVHLEADMTTQNSYTYTWDETPSVDAEGVEDTADPETLHHTSSYNNDVSMHMVYDSATVDGLNDASANCAIISASSSTYDEETYEYEQSVEFILTNTERAEDDGSVTASVALDVTVDDENLSASFDLNRAESAPVDYFDGMDEYAITADMDEEDPTSTLLAADAMNFGADAMTLTADDSIIALVNLINGAASGEETDASPAYDEPEAVHSFAEAAPIFEGTLPNFTTPEGYSLEEIEVDDSYFCATYASDAGNFSLSTFGYVADGLEYYSFENGELQSASNGMVEISRYDGELVDSATLYTPNGTLYFYFDDFELEEVEAILANLTF